MRDALLVDIPKLKAQIREENTNQSLALASRALMRRHHKLRDQTSRNLEERTLRRSRRKAAQRARRSAHRPNGGDAGDYPIRTVGHYWLSGGFSITSPVTPMYYKFL